jgi:hypothetical protein
MRIDVDVRHIDDGGNYGYHRRLRGSGVVSQTVQTNIAFLWLPGA